MMMSSKTKPVAFKLDGEDGHVLILNPLLVPVKVHCLTVNPLTSFSLAFLPRLPTLMPWPGPHNTLKMVKLVQPGPMEMQSSPVPMTELATWILVESAMWMPSVLGLSPGALILMESRVMSLDSKICMWNNLLSIEEMLLMVAFVTKLNTKFYRVVLLVQVKVRMN